MNRRIFLVVAGSLIALTGCGGSSKSGPKSFLKDISGVWSGIIGGAAASMNLEQRDGPNNSELLTGSFTFFGETSTVAGVKNGNNVTLSGSAGDTRFVAELVLGSDTQMSGSLAQATGTTSSTVTASFTKV